MKYLILLLPFLLVACDKGKIALDQVKKDHGPVVTEPLTLEKAKMADSYWRSLNMLKIAMPDAADGFETESSAFFTKVKTFLDEQRAMVTKKRDQMEANLTAITLKTDVIQKNIRGLKIKGSQKFGFQPGDCIAVEHGQEFDSLPSLFELEILRIEKVGERNLLVRRVFRVRQGETIREDWLKNFRAEEPLELYQEYALRAVKLDCTDGEKIAEEFQRATDANISLKVDVDNFNTYAKLLD